MHFLMLRMSVFNAFEHDRMRPCGVKRLANMYTIACGVFLARAHLLALPPHRLRSFATFFSQRFSLRRFPCTNSSHCTELASSPLFHGIALFSASAYLRRLTSVAAFSLYEHICSRSLRIASAHSQLSFRNAFPCGVFLARTHPIAPSSHLHRSFIALLFQ